MKSSAILLCSIEHFNVADFLEFPTKFKEFSLSAIFGHCTLFFRSEEDKCKKAPEPKMRPAGQKDFTGQSFSKNQKDSLAKNLQLLLSEFFCRMKFFDPPQSYDPRHPFMVFSGLFYIFLRSLMPKKSSGVQNSYFWVVFHPKHKPNQIFCSRLQWILLISNKNLVNNFLWGNCLLQNSSTMLLSPFVRFWH